MAEEKNGPQPSTANDSSQGRKPALIPVFSMYAIIAVILLSGLGAIVGSSLTTIGNLATDTRDNVLPAIFDRQRTAINLERLGRFALIVHKAEDPKQRRTFKLAAKILSQDTAFANNPVIRSKVSQCYQSIERLALMRNRQDSLQKKIETVRAKAQERLIKGRSAAEFAKRREEQTALNFIIHLLAAKSHEDLEGLRQQLDKYAPSGDPSKLDREIEKLDKGLRLRSIFNTKHRELDLENNCEKAWTEVNRELETMSASLTANAAIKASRSFTIIADEASAGINGGLTALIISIATMILMLVLIRRDVLAPISNMVHAMARARSSHTPVILPPARLRELHEIKTSVEQSSTLTAEIAKRTQELEQTNAVLEKEIRERSRTEKELARAKEAAEAADNAKSDFLAGMSHEIRTPMNTILGMAELMLETDPNPEQRKYIEMFKTSGHQLLGIINDVLDISKIEAGQLSIEKRDISLTEILDKIYLLYSTKAKDKGLGFSINIDRDTPDRIIGDPVRISQILTNLVDNAVKFTHQGLIRVEVYPAPSEIAGEINFTVSDTGIGIPPESQRRVFERFTQADSSTTRQYGGTGLGLSISRRLVETMGGTLRLSSSPSKGTTFTFMLRFELPAEAPAPDPDIALEEIKYLTQMLQERPASILLVEDSDSNRQLLQFYLAKTGCEIDFAENGEQAVLMFKENRYDVVLMDIQMPVMDGFEATRQIRAYEKANSLPPTPVIAVTANALSEDRGRCIEAGCTFYLAKPISKTLLLKTVASTVGIV